MQKLTPQKQVLAYLNICSGLSKEEWSSSLTTIQEMQLIIKEPDFQKHILDNPVPEKSEKISIAAAQLLKIVFYMVLTSVIYVSVCTSGMYQGHTWIDTFQGAANQVVLPSIDLAFSFAFDWDIFFLVDFDISTQWLFSMGIVIALFDDAIKVFDEDE